QERPGRPRSQGRQMTPVELTARAARIELLLLDVDGVLTDGSVVYSDAGEELKRFHVRDGSGLKLWRAAGKRAAIVSGRASAAVERRAAELGIAPVLQGRDDKLRVFEELLAALGLTADRVCAVGDDLADLPVLTRAGLAIAVADACPEVRAAAHRTTIAPGGRGAVREAVEWLLRLQGRWDELIAGYRPAG
ncbi:MAG TPA: HAD family hydrolase, partial [Fimbriiglobus sp.]|nr:HAD family hydrolase [Fimbriiglobus sp.]